MKARHAREIRAGIHWGRFLAALPRPLGTRILTSRQARGLQGRVARDTYNRTIKKENER